MCHEAPRIIYLFDRMGVPFSRTAEGNLDFRRFGGTLYHRTAFAGASTGQQLLYALDEQVRRYEAEGLVKKFEFWEFLEPVLDGAGRCWGIVAVDRRSMKVEAFRADATIVATGGLGLVYGRSTNSVICTGSAGAACYLAGARFGNAEMVQIHPTAIPGEDKLRLMSESARGEGGRVWVPRAKGDTRDPKQIPDGERWYFLEEKYPRFGNLVPRDIGSREIFHVVYDLGLGVGGNSVYLDLTHKTREYLDRRLGAILEIYEKFVGDDPRTVPMRIFPAVHYSMGGLWVDYQATAEGFLDPTSPRNHMTNVPGLYAAGEAEYQYHGANRLGANALLSCVYAGLVSGPAASVWAAQAPQRAADVAAAPFAAAETKWNERFAAYRGMSGPENAYVIHRELGELMTENVTIVRHNDKLKQADEKVSALMERFRRIGGLDANAYMNADVAFANQLWNMLELARLITRAAVLRDESRGAHYKPAFPQRDDEQYLKSTIATWAPDGPRFEFEPVDTSILKPVARKYD